MHCDVAHEPCAVAKHLVSALPALGLFAPRSVVMLQFPYATPAHLQALTFAPELLESLSSDSLCKAEICHLIIQAKGNRTLWAKGPQQSHVWWRVMRALSEYDFARHLA